MSNNMSKEEAIHVIQFAASRLQREDMRLSERLMEALQTLMMEEPK